MGYRIPAQGYVIQRHDVEQAYQQGLAEGRKEAEGRLQCMRLGAALQTAALKWIPAPTAPGEIQSVERGLYELRRHYPHLQWDISPRSGWVRATDEHFQYDGIPRFENGVSRGWAFELTAYNKSLLGTGEKCLRFISGVQRKGPRQVYAYATWALSDAIQQAQQHFSDMMGALEGEQ